MALYFYFIRFNAFSCDTKDLHLHLHLFIGCDNIWDCCTNENPCGLNMGDCDLNDHCMNDLVCGIANCGAGFPVNTDCCENSGTYISSLILFCSKFQDSSYVQEFKLWIIAVLGKVISYDYQMTTKPKETKCEICSTLV